LKILSDNAIHNSFTSITTLYNSSNFNLFKEKITRLSIQEKRGNAALSWHFMINSPFVRLRIQISKSARYLLFLLFLFIYFFPDLNAICRNNSNYFFRKEQNHLSVCSGAMATDLSFTVLLDLTRYLLSQIIQQERNQLLPLLGGCFLP
jgi:hypothetical protein